MTDEELLDLRTDFDYRQKYGDPVLRQTMAWSMIRLGWAWHILVTEVRAVLTRWLR